MKISEYLKDKLIVILIEFLSIILIMLILTLFDVILFVRISICIIMIWTYLLSFIYIYNKKTIFYKKVETTLKNLDQKYLLTELIKEPNFIEGKLLCEYLYEINKSFLEKLNSYKYQKDEFEEYLELWCHEIKTPVATAKLIIENNPGKTTESIHEEILKIDEYIEKVLYYARSENVEKDYLINKVDLEKVINNVIKNNKKDILNKKIKIKINFTNIFVKSDAKWLEFIINQIVINSIKYTDKDKSIIKFDVETNKNNIILHIEDNGIGIENDEIERVFDKCFTGSNGRKKYNSTGIGLFLCKKLCDKLGHNILVNSKINEKTIVTIIFPNNSMTK